MVVELMYVQAMAIAPMMAMMSHTKVATTMAPSCAGFKIISDLFCLALDF